MFEGLWGKGKKKDLTDSPPPTPEDAASKFTLPHLKNVHSQLMKHKAEPASNEVIVVESLRMIAEMVVYGDKKCELLFDFFCEKNMLALFLEIMRAEAGCPTSVHIQILQTLSIMCQCVRNNTSIYYLLSNNYINEIIDFPFDFEEEDGACDNFISFMKSLSLRLNSQTVQFFFVEENDSFPLLSRAIGFLQFKDPMVRTAAQATILNVLRINEDRSRDFALRDDVLQAFAAEVVVSFESQHSAILALCLEYCAYTSHPNTRELTKGKVGNRIEDQLQNIFNGLEDWLYYLQDLFRLCIPKLTYILSSQLISQYIYPVLLDPFTRNQQWKLSEVFLSRKSDTKNADTHNSIPAALNMDYFSKNGDVLLDRRGESLDLDGDRNDRNDDDAPNELSREDSSVSLIVSMFLMNQMLDIIREKRIRRSIMVALLHPFSQQQRKLVLNKARHESHDVGSRNEMTTEAMNESEAISLLQVGFNSYRNALGQIMSSERDRFSLLACLLIGKFVHLDVAECHDRSKSTSEYTMDDTVEYARNAVAPLSLLNFCSPAAPYLPLKEIGINEGDSCNEHFGNKVENHETNGDVSILSNNANDDVRNSQDRNGNQDFQESDRNGRQRGRSEDMNDGRYESGKEGCLDSGLKNVIYDADGISVKGLSVLSEYVQYVSASYDTLKSMQLKSNPNNCGLDNKTILSHILSLLNSANVHSLALLQTVALLVYDIASLSHFAHKPTSSSDVSFWQCPADILECKAAVLSALQNTAKYLQVRAKGWLSDTLLSQLEEEIRRSLGGEKNWVQVLHKMSRNLLMVLPPIGHLTSRLGFCHSTPVSAVESSRRELQVFLLLRSLYLCLSRLSSSPFAMSSPQDLSDSLVDELILIFSEHGGSTEPYSVGSSIDWEFRNEKPISSCVVYPRLPDAPNGINGSHSSESPKGSSPSSPQPLTEALIANGVKVKNKLSPIPKLVGSHMFRSHDGPRRLGEVVFIRDNTTLLLVVPDQAEDGEACTKGTVLVAVPLHRTDVVSDDDDTRNIKLLVRSPVPISSMVCLSSPDSGEPKTYDKLKMASILPPRSARVLYQMVIGFESKVVCDEVIKIIETQRLQIQSSRIDSLRQMLGAWVDTTT